MLKLKNFTIILFVFFYSISTNGQTSKNFRYGINGHPFSQEAYRNNLNLQIRLLKKINALSYRIDIPTTNEGYIIHEKETLDWLIKFKNSGIKIIPVFTFDKSIYLSKSPIDNYKSGRSFGKIIALRYKQYFDYYEVGNEEANNIIIGPHVHGDKIEHYLPEKSQQLISFIKGICESIKKGDPTAKIIINEGWVHYGFFMYLKEHKVSYDIIGYHGYSEMGDMFSARENFGNVIDTLYKKFKKNIWVTEMNIRNGPSIYKNSTHEAWFIKNIKFLRKNKYVKAVFIYELFDQPAFGLIGSKYSNPTEANYGLIIWTKNYSESKEKPLFNIYKNFIKENP